MALLPTALLVTASLALTSPDASSARLAELIGLDVDFSGIEDVRLCRETDLQDYVGSRYDRHRDFVCLHLSRDQVRPVSDRLDAALDREGCRLQSAAGAAAIYRCGRTRIEMSGGPISRPDGDDQVWLIIINRR